MKHIEQKIMKINYVENKIVFLETGLVFDFISQI